MNFKTAIAGIGLVLSLAYSSANAQNSLDTDPVLAQKVINAKPGDLRILATAAIREPLQAVREQAEKAVGRPLVIEYGSARGNLKDNILAGQEFELAILLPDVDQELLKQGKILPQSHVIARVPTAIGLRTEGAVPVIDISTSAALKTALLNAKSVRYGRTGVAYDTVDKILTTLGVANSIKDTSKLDRFKRVELAPGEYEINIYPVSEVISNKELKNLGLVPAELQVPGVLEAVVGQHANEQKTVDALIKFLQGPAMDRPLQESGMLKGK